MRKRTTLLTALFFFSPGAFSQNARVEWSAFSSGFALPNSPTTVAASSVGQSFVGTSRIANSVVESGFLVNPLLRGPLVGIVEHPSLPGVFSLSQNYPNPFNPSTKIRFSIPPFIKGGKGGFVSLKIYNLLGQEVATLVNEEMRPGRYEVPWNAAGFASGTYFYRLSAGTFVETKKLILLK